MRITAAYISCLLFMSPFLSTGQSFAGGDGDGYASSCYIQSNHANSITFLGGDADAFDYSCFAQSDNPFVISYEGGNGDGFDFSCYTQADNTLSLFYDGGNGDGYIMTCYTQSDPAAAWSYSGGNGDGFSIACPVGLQALPVTWLDFYVKSKNGKVDLNWATGTEINHDYFSIQKSVNGINFFEFDKVYGDGDSYQRKNYRIPDSNPRIGITYYRLKQVDYNGTYEYSKVIRNVLDKAGSENNFFTAYTGLNSGNSFIHYSISGIGEYAYVDLEIFDVTGKQVYIETIQTNVNGIASDKLDISSMLPSSGAYLIRASFKDQSETQTLFIR